MNYHQIQLKIDQIQKDNEFNVIKDLTVLRNNHLPRYYDDNERGVYVYEFAIKYLDVVKRDFTYDDIDSSNIDNSDDIDNNNDSSNIDNIDDIDNSDDNIDNSSDIDNKEYKECINFWFDTLKEIISFWNFKDKSGPNIIANKLFINKMKIFIEGYIKENKDFNKYFKAIEAYIWYSYSYYEVYKSDFICFYLYKLLKFNLTDKQFNYLFNNFESISKKTYRSYLTEQLLIKHKKLYNSINSFIEKVIIEYKDENKNRKYKVYNITKTKILTEGSYSFGYINDISQYILGNNIIHPNCEFIYEEVNEFTSIIGIKIKKAIIKK